jgi:hypothetical protein
MIILIENKTTLTNTPIPVIMVIEVIAISKNLYMCCVLDVKCIRQDLVLHALNYYLFYFIFKKKYIIKNIIFFKYYLFIYLYFLL